MNLLKFFLTATHLRGIIEPWKGGTNPMGKKKKKPSSKLDTIQKIVSILAGIVTIVKMIFDMLKG